jgi:hypothetical protein
MVYAEFDEEGMSRKVNLILEIDGVGKVYRGDQSRSMARKRRSNHLLATDCILKCVSLHSLAADM